MKKHIALALIMSMGLSALSFAQSAKKTKSEESLFLDLQKTGLGSMNELEEKKKFIETIKLEKQKIQDKMLLNVYENAFDYYRQGNYQDAKDMAGKILSIDPGFEDASMLMEASNELRGSARPGMSEKNMLEDRFKSALFLYNEGRIVDAHKKMEEVVKLSPNNIKAKYWLGKMKEDLRVYYYDRGERAYSKQDLKGALDNFYNSLLLRPRDAKTIAFITKVEDELKQEQVNAQLKVSLEYYAQGKLIQAYEGLRKVLEIQPGDAKAGKLLAEVKNEIEQGYIAKGRKLYADRRYAEAITEWNTAKMYTSNLAYLDKMTARAREQIRIAADEKRRKADMAAKRAKEEEERRSKEEAARQQGGGGQAGGPMEQGSAPQGVTEENKVAAQQHYVEGLKYFQNANYEKARDEWAIARQLDPTNSDADAGLKRIEQIISTGQ